MYKSKIFLMLTTQWLFRIGLPLAVLSLIMAYGAVQLRHARTLYRASSRIWVQKSYFSGGKGAEPGEIPDSPLMEGSTNLATFCEIVQSDAVLQLAYDELKKKLPEEQLPGRESLASVRATPAKDANIITIDYRSPYPDVPDVVVKAVISALMKENAMQIAGPLEETRQRLNKQLEIARDEYNQSKAKLRAFEDSVGTIDFSGDADSMTSARTDLQQQLEDGQNELKVLQTKIDFLQTQLGFGPEDILAVEKISNDEVVNSLKETIAQNEVKLIELKSKFQDDHPKVKRLKAVLDDAKKEMAARYSVLIGKVDPKFDGINKNSDAQHQLLSDMLEARTDMVAGQSKMKSLQESLHSLNERLSVLPERQQEMADLQRQDELATNTLAAVESELQRVKLTESVSLSSSRLQVIDSNQFVETSAIVNMPVVIIIAVVSAAAVAVAQVFLDPRILFTSHLQPLNLPMTSWFPRIKEGLSQAIPHADRLRLAIKNWLDSSNVIWITSPNNGDGKSLTARALAESFADAGQRVLLIDANLSRPSLHIDLKETASPGLLQYLEGDADEAIIREVRPNFHFIPAGGINANMRLLSGPECNRLLTQVKELYDAVVVDGPSSGLDDCGLQIPECHPNLLISVRFGNTLKPCVQILKNQIGVVPLSEIGMVVHNVKSSDITTLTRDAALHAAEASNLAPAAVASSDATADHSSTVATW